MRVGNGIGITGGVARQDVDRCDDRRGCAGATEDQLLEMALAPAIVAALLTAVPRLAKEVLFASTRRILQLGHAAETMRVYSHPRQTGGVSFNGCAANPGRMCKTIGWRRRVGRRGTEDGETGKHGGED